MTNIVHCATRQPMVCWQYTEADPIAPLWALPFLTYYATGVVYFRDDTDENGGPLLFGDWLVHFPSGDNDGGYVYAHSDGDFSNAFVTMPPPRPKLKKVSRS